MNSLDAGSGDDRKRRAQTDVVLNAFQRLLIKITRCELDTFAEFDNDERTFTLLRAPEGSIPTGRYFFKRA